MLRTVPVLLSNGDREMRINALLDDGSTQTYLNSSVAAELGLQGRLQQVTVNVLNWHQEMFQTMPVECRLRSVDGRVDMGISAFTTDKVTGNLEVVDWNRNAARWPHLRGIQFPKFGSRPFVDLLIGLDYADLHYSLRDIRGAPGEPIARLTPLGWTCIGAIQCTSVRQYVNHIRTYYHGDGQLEFDDTVCQLLRQFWELENVPWLL